jgi:hypothetical protein
MAVTLGVEPLAMTLVLVQDADFVCTLVSQDGDWPGTAVLSIEVGDAAWSATLAGTEARFNVDKAVVNPVIDVAPRRFRLLYTDGDTDLVWGSGSVVCRRG